LVSSADDLALSDVQPNRRRVVILEVVQIGATAVTELISNSSASRARESSNDVAVAWSKSKATERLGNTRTVVVGGSRSGYRAEFIKLGLSVSGECEGGRLELRLKREIKDQ